MTTRRLDRQVDSKCSCAADSDDVVVDAGLRRQKVARSVLGGPPSLFFFVSLQINCEGIDSSSGQFLSYIVPRVASAVALWKQEHSRTWSCRRKVSCLHNR